ncbi:MAG: hypothetical protein ACOCWK_07540 [Tangfeifania sp.]
MKRFCFCAEIHIPTILPRHKTYTRNGENDNRYLRREEKTVKKIASENILPFFQFVQKMNSPAKKKVKTGISVSGIALTLLQKYAPEVIARLSFLKQNGYIELFSETWSNSAVSCFNKNSFRRQVQQHDRLMQTYFREIPQLLYVNSPVYPDDFIDNLSGLGKRAVFINSNMLDESIFQKFFGARIKTNGEVLVFPVNYAMSRMMQDLDFSFLQQKTPFYSRAVLCHLKKQGSDNFPSIINFNLTREKCFFHLSRSLTWEKLFKEMLADSGTEFISPSETLDAKNTAGLKETDFSEILSRATLFDVWMKNNYQVEAFKQQLNIDARLNEIKSGALLSEWDILQDMDHLYYMDDKFAGKGFAMRNFNPFPGPAAAYENYMEILDKFLDKIKTRTALKPGVLSDTLNV